ncbi:RDX [Lepeophtheirus salmonis]|uniref:RDX n=1 Tax=Lepeophtheirus salmonis TaxID=72036 RepID=A0A7R8CRN9_LEPSM|nr:RDX [Lepeophtheirus salmonis]CAF2907120.1 RDX [Lepeophtheirus salmonis]
MRRRKPDTIEVQQMKAQNKEEKLAKQQEREKLQREIAAREKAERIQAEYEDRLKAMQEDMEKRQKALLEAQEQIKKLESVLRETQDAKQELEESQNELKDMMRRLEDDKNLEIEERTRLQDEIARKQSEVNDIYTQVQTKEQENMELQKEMDDARRKHEEATIALVAATTTPKHHHLEEDDNDDEVSNSERDLHVPSDPIDDPVSDRLLLVERNERLQNQLKSLKEDLSHTRDEGEETTMDRIHKENVKQGRDKYKTLREVRKGNTKRRVDQFENIKKMKTERHLTIAFFRRVSVLIFIVVYVHFRGLYFIWTFGTFEYPLRMNYSSDGFHLNYRPDHHNNSITSMAIYPHLLRSVAEIRRQILELTEEQRQLNRNYQTSSGIIPNFNIGRGYQCSRILLLSKLPEHLQNPDAVFFIMENFGRVERVKILNKKRHTALVQMSYSHDAARALREFNGLMERAGHDVRIVEATNVYSINMPKAGQEFTEGTKDYSVSDIPSENTLHQLYINNNDLYDDIHSNKNDREYGNVILVSNLPERLQNVDYLFNLFGHYGNVDRIKIPINKRTCALIQYTKPHYSQNAKKYLDEEVRKGNRDKAELNKDFTEEKILQRFKNRERAARIQRNLCPPTATIHISNLEENLREENLRQYFIERGFTVKNVLDFKNGMAVITLADSKEGAMAVSTCHGDNKGIASKKSIGIFISFSKRVK